MTIEEALKHGRERLAAHSESPGLDAQVTLAHTLGRSRAWLLAHPEAAVPAEIAAIYLNMLAQLEKGTPLPYVLGSWEFFGRRFKVSPAVLIPRPETELLVEEALAVLRTRTNPAAPPRVVDVGTGSGCIAITLAAEIPGLRLAALDISGEALAVARENAARHGVDRRLDFLLGDLLESLEGPFDLVCANLPYIPSATLDGLAVFGKEPTLALDGGPDGLALVKRLLAQLAPGGKNAGRLAPGGMALLEIEATTGAAALALARQTFPGAGCSLLTDLAGHDRVLRIEG